MHLRRSHPITMFSVWFLTVFLVLFPKGGIKVGPVPITWGYIYIALITMPLTIIRLICFRLSVPARVLWAEMMAIPLQILIVYTILSYGILDYGYGISTVIGLIVFPALFLFIFPSYFPFIDGERFARYLRLCILLAALWGIFLFFWRPIMGYFVEIPLLTVNLDDYGMLETTKYIQRGFFFKLISTYNNGNIYGISILMLSPLYNLLEKSRWRRWTVKLSLFLTLSRTVWFAMILAELMPLFSVFMKQAFTFPRLRLSGAGRSLLMVGTTFLLVAASLLFNSNASFSFLFDPTLGGRQTSLSDIAEAGLLPMHGLNAFSEIVYASAAREFGFAGFFAFALLMTSPLLLLLFDRTALRVPHRSAACKGLLLYAFIAGSDGGIAYIPVLAFYWFLYMIYLYGWPESSSNLASVTSSKPHLDLHAIAAPS